MENIDKTKAIIFKETGKHELITRHIPRITEPDQLLVKIEAASICGSDVHILADPPGCVAVPGVIIGHEMVGEIIGIGGSVKNYRAGDRIVCDPNISCGQCSQCKTGRPNMCENLHILGVDIDGFFAQYALVPERSALKISQELSSEKAIFAEPLTCVLSAVNKVRLLPGENVAIIGAGPIGLYFASLLKANGAGKVFVIEVSDFRCSSALRMGADEVLNPKIKNVSKEINTLTKGKGVNLVVDAVGVCIEEALRLVSMGGRILLFGQNSAEKETICQNDITRKEVTIYGSYIGPQTFTDTVRLLESNLIDFSKMITHRITLDEFDIGLEAMRRGTALEVIIYPNI